jgi:ADP-ribose pyrophosphatase YjhB (NUDIX family)
MMIPLVRLAFRLSVIWSWIVRPVTIGVRIVLLQEGKILLVRHTYMPGWHCPGGSLNRWETPLEAAVREAKEEVGAELLETPELVEIVTQYSESRSDHIATYLCRSFRLGEATDRWEIAERRFFAVDALPRDLYGVWPKLLRKLASEQKIVQK